MTSAASTLSRALRALRSLVFSQINGSRVAHNLPAPTSLTLPPRSFDLSLSERSPSLTLGDRSLDLTLDDRSLGLTLRERSTDLTIEDGIR
ncbi:MAG: hypothetical protein IPO81_09525 [Kouleothrix sp.]|nr:hypothetical protein [Kouleothrix sp.]